MAYDFYGRWVPDDIPAPRDSFGRVLPGWERYINYNSQQPGFNQGVGQQQRAPYNQTASGMSVTPPLIHVEMEQVKAEREVRDAIVPSDGTPRMFMTEDEQLVAFKRMTGNGIEIGYYDRRPDAPAAPQIDPNQLVLRSEIGGIVNSIIDQRIAANDAAAYQRQQSAPPADGFADAAPQQDDSAQTARSAARRAGGKAVGA